jgi:hypothetical protein
MRAEVSGTTIDRSSRRRDAPRRARQLRGCRRTNRSIERKNAVVNREPPMSADCCPHPRIGLTAVCYHMITRATRAAFLISDLAYHPLRISSCSACRALPGRFCVDLINRNDQGGPFRTFSRHFCFDLTHQNDQDSHLELFLSSFCFDLTK